MVGFRGVSAAGPGGVAASRAAEGRHSADERQRDRERASGVAVRGCLMTWADQMRRGAARLAGRGLDLLCPPRCAACGTDLAGLPASASAICGPCRRLFSPAERCTACGGTCAAGSCRGPTRRGDWDGIAVLGGYGDELRQPVLRAKRPGGEPLAAALGRLCVERHAATLAGWQIDAVVPVPMHWWRRAVRGATAAGEIARGVAAALERPVLNVLVRTRCTPLQNRLPFADRRGNVSGAFRSLPVVAGRRVLLVDDVVTTGGTCAACRAALVAAGAAAVFVAAVARAERDDDVGGGTDA